MNPRYSLMCLPRWLGLATFALLVGCGPADAEHETRQAETPSPSVDSLRLATHPGYVTPPNIRQECLGRLVFDTPRDIEWGLSRPGLSSGDHFRFTEHLRGGGEYVSIDGITAVVLAPAKWADIEGMQSGTNADKNIAIREYQNKIEIIKGIEADRLARLKNPDPAYTKEDLEGISASIERDKNRVPEIEANIASMEKGWHPIDLGLPQSLGYKAGSTLYAFLLRDGRAYQFMSARADGDPPFEVRQAAFFDFMKRFRTRALYEIPTEPGVCIPYGFVADDGTSHSRTVVSFRYKDRPGVLYTLGAQIPGEQGFEGEAALVQATSGALAGKVGIGREPKTIGPRQANIGALPAWQGGFSLNVAAPGKPAVRNYSVYTGTDGYPHSRVLPAIRLRLLSFTREQEPSLTSNPPPFEESLARLDALLKSIRLRPTDPVMPELKGVATP